MSEQISIFDQLEEKMAGYTRDDYLTCAPYEYAAELSGNNIIRYIQLLNVLLKDAMDKKVRLSEAQTYSDYVQFHIRPKWGHNFLQHIVTTGQTTPDDNKIHVLPLMCGTGKSNAISHMMSQRIAHHLQVAKHAETLPPDDRKDYGILIVTDSIERAREYYRPGKQAPNALALINHPALATLMTHENFMETRLTMKQNPVLIMTTQRFLTLSAEDLEEYLTWDYGRRNLIVIDEQPMLLQYVSLTYTSLSVVTGMIGDKIPGSDEKDWCLTQWKKVEERIEQQFHELERRRWETNTLHPNGHCYHTLPEGERYFTENDTYFWSIINRHRSPLSECYATICAAEKMLKEGAVYSCTRLQQRYENIFGIILDHRSKLVDAGAKVVIFDGTGDITPDYLDDRFVVNHEFSAEFRRDLSKMKITFINQNTSKYHMGGDADHQELNGMVDQIEEIFQKKKGAIFTYQKEESALRRIIDARGLAGQMYIQHFGAIRGSNQYRDMNHIAQIGLFCRTPMEYLCRALALNPEKFEEFKGLSMDEGNLWIRAYTENDQQYLANQTRMLLADTEQNLFRGLIRDPRNTDNYYYYIFCSKRQHEDLFLAMKERYPEVSIEWREPPLEQRLNKIRRSGRNSVAKKIVTFYDALLPGEEFTAQRIEHELDIRYEQLKEARRNPDLDELFMTTRIAGTQRYRKPQTGGDFL